jgi:hypothetical protein
MKVESSRAKRAARVPWIITHGIESPSLTELAICCRAAIIVSTCVVSAARAVADTFILYVTENTKDSALENKSVVLVRTALTALSALADA